MTGDEPVQASGNGDAPEREFVPPPVAAAPEIPDRDAVRDPAPDPAREPPPPPQGATESAAPAPYKPASTYTVWSSTPGEGHHFGPKE